MAFSWRKSVTIASAQCGSVDSSNFPVTIFVTDADLKDVAHGGNVQSSSGYDVRPHDNLTLTSAMTYQLVGYDGATGTIEMHVLIPTLSHTVDTVFYLGFGDATLTSDGSSTSTWPSAFKAVYHFGTAASLSANDATGNAQNGTATGVTATTGEIGGGANFDGTTGHRILVADNAAFTFTDFTISMWINSSNTGLQLLVEQLGTQAWGLYTTGGTLHGFATQSTGQDDSSGTNVCTGAWVHIAFVRDTANSIRRFYINGSDIAHPADTQGGSINATDSVAIGERYNGGAEQFPLNGIMDELRFANTPRLPSWITAEYNNQKPSSTFLTWGSLTSMSSFMAMPPTVIRQAARRASYW